MLLNLNPIYQFFKYLGVLKIFLRFKQPYLLVDGHKLYFNNYNVIGILEKANADLGIRETIYRSIDLYIDIGAHFGITSFLFNIVSPQTQIIAFEPNPITYKFLKKNVQHIKKIKTFNVGLSNKDSRENLYIDKQHLDTSSLNKNSHYMNKNTKTKLVKRSVKTEKLDNYYNIIKDKKNIYLKIDVETHEKFVLLGAQKTLQKVKYLELEVYQGAENRLSDILELIPREYNIISCDLLLPDKIITKPRTVTILLELF